MVSERNEPRLTSEQWNCDSLVLSKELRSFVEEFGSFTPDWFVEVKYHLLKGAGFDRTTRDELCSVSIYSHTCDKCDHLYMSKNCLLWYHLFKLITWKTVGRAPPCIKAAYRNKSIKTVANFLKRANLVSPPYYLSRGVPLCRNMQDWDYCSPDEYCKQMRTGRLLAYNAVREQVKINR